MLTATRPWSMQGDAQTSAPNPAEPRPSWDTEASNAYERLYLQLLELARARWRSERRGNTLQATAVANEVFLRLRDFDPARFKSELELRRYLSGAIRNYLLEYAQRRQRDARGGQWRRVELDDAVAVVEARTGQGFEMLERRLRELATSHPKEAQVVELRFFAGLTYAAIGQALGLSERQAEGLWLRGKEWLQRRLKNGEEPRR